MCTHTHNSHGRPQDFSRDGEINGGRGLDPPAGPGAGIWGKARTRSRHVLKITHKYLLRKLNLTQPTKIFLDVSVSIRGLRQKKMELILLPVLATVVM